LKGEKTSKEVGGKMIVACVGIYGERVGQALIGIKRLQPHVDRYVVVADETVTEDHIQALKDAGCEVYIHRWEDSMVKMRNQYLDKVQTDDWVIVHDPDELFNERFCEDVKKIIAEVDSKPIDLVLINSHDIDIRKDGSSDERASDFFKNLIFRKRAGTHYEGVGQVKEVHETLVIPGLQQQVNLDKRIYWYQHTKYWWEVWERAARNVFIAGGGNNVGEINPSWRPLREICSELGLINWPLVREYFRKGNIDSRLKKWLWINRFEGFDWQHEMMEFGRWYFEYLHPEEAEGWKPVLELRQGSPAEVMRYIEECYMKILGRHADQPGKEAYATAILQGQIRREDLPDVLKRSREYVEKFGKAPSETVKIQVPVNVQIGLTEGIIIDAISKSKTWHEKIKPRLDVGLFLEIALEQDWKKFQKWFYEKQPDLKQFIRKLEKMLRVS